MSEDKITTGQQYAHYVGAPAFFLLNQACRVFYDAFGEYPYLVGSSLNKRDWRDVDVRLILDDTEYVRFFPELATIQNDSLSALFNVMCSSISLWLSKEAGLPIDFQIQRRSEANARFPSKEGHRRQVLGMFLAIPEVKS
jgi:hypothetical protein